MSDAHDGDADPLDPDVLAARLWVDEQIATPPWGPEHLDLIRDRQEQERERFLAEEKAAEDAAFWLRALHGAADDFLRGPHKGELGVEVHCSYHYPPDPDPYLTLLDLFGEDGEDLVTVWRNERTVDVFGDEAMDAIGAFLYRAKRYGSWDDVDGEDNPESADGVVTLLDQMRRLEGDRARRRRHDASRAGTRADAAEWRASHPAEPVTGLTEEQADLVVSITEAADRYQDDVTRHARGSDGEPLRYLPEARRHILVHLSDMARKEGGTWSADRVRSVASEIGVPWPLPYDRYHGGPIVPDVATTQLRPLYQTGGPGRLTHEAERREAHVLVMGADRLLALAEQVLANPSGE